MPSVADDDLSPSAERARAIEQQAAITHMQRSEAHHPHRTQPNRNQHSRTQVASKYYFVAGPISETAPRSGVVSSCRRSLSPTRVVSRMPVYTQSPVRAVSPSRISSMSPPPMRLAMTSPLRERQTYENQNVREVLTAHSPGKMRIFSPDLYSSTRDEHNYSTELMSSHSGIIGLGCQSRRVLNVGGDLYTTYVEPPERKPLYSPTSPEYKIVQGNLVDHAFGMMPANLHSKLEQVAQESDSVKMMLKLQLDYTKTIGGGSDVREQFEADVKMDLAAATNLAAGCFRIKRVSPGMKMASVIVDMEVLLDPFASIALSTAVNILASQANDSQSTLRCGKVTHAVSAVHAVDLDGNTLVKLILPYRTMAPQLLVEASPSKAKGMVSAEIGVANEEMSDFSLLGGGGGHVARATRAAPPQEETVDDYVSIPDTTLKESKTDDDAFEKSEDDDNMVQIQRQSRRVQRSAAPLPAPARMASAAANPFPAPLPLPETCGDNGDVLPIQLDSRRVQRAAAPRPFSGVDKAADLVLTPLLSPVAVKLEFEPEYLKDFHIDDVASMLRMQLASAVSLPDNNFKVNKMDNNSVDVSIHANSSGVGPDPYAVAVRLDGQSRDENSALRQGAISGYIRRVTILKDPVAVTYTALAVSASLSSEQRGGMAPFLQKSAVNHSTNNGLVKVGTKETVDSSTDSSTSGQHSMLENFSEFVKYSEPSADATALFSSSAAFLQYSQCALSRVRGSPSKTDDLKTSEASFPLKFPAGYRIDPTKVDRITLEDRGQVRPMKGSVEKLDLSSKLNSTESEVQRIYRSEDTERDVQRVYRIEDREYVGREYRAGPRLPPASGRITLADRNVMQPSPKVSSSTISAFKQRDEFSDQRQGSQYSPR